MKDPLTDRVEVEEERSTQVGRKLAPFNPTNTVVVDWAIEQLALTPDDLFIDLGCGDGRVVYAAQSHCRAIGVDYDETLVNRARQRCGDGAELMHANVLDAHIVDLVQHRATKLFVYLVPEGLAALQEPFTAALQRGATIVSYIFQLRFIEPSKTHTYKGVNVYLYRQIDL
eukprot:GEMP01080176.1.p1 GENE.GEMP01080176.1~~GEMP01080176.1.p1  ORF type:complete len:171 (+),score=33.00 GEMP01080176.1:411-923(+)